MIAHVLLVALFALGAAVSLWGWGRLSGRLAGSATSGPLTLALGLGAVVFVGGVLNALRLAVPLAVDAVLLLGAALALAEWWRRPAPERFRFRPTRADCLAALPIVIVLAFVAACLAPQRVFNHYDDFHKYFDHPVRMLATGTVAGSPLNAMGSETLGGQAWLQGLVLAHRPLPFVAGVDTVFGLLLCLVLAGYAVRPTGWAGPALVAELCVAAIDPQIVNSSALYTGAACIAGLVVLGAGAQRAGSKPFPAAFLGLLYAALLALKATFAGFVVGHALALAAVRLWSGAGARRTLGALLGAAGWTVLFVSPWVLMHVPLYLAAARGVPVAPPSAQSEPVMPFSTAPLVYGSTAAHYTAMALGALLIALAGLWLCRKDGEGPSGPLQAACAALLATAAVYGALITVVGPRLMGRHTATRYGVPVFIGCLPVALRLLAGLDGTTAGRRLRMLALAAGALVVAGFLPTALPRVRQIAAFHTPLALGAVAADPEYRRYNEAALQPSGGARLAGVQSLVPPGETVMAWVSTPFWLDFARNRVLEANLAGLGAPWARVPPSTRYFIWEYGGLGVLDAGEYREIIQMGPPVEREHAARAMKLVDDLKARARNADVLYNDGSLIAFRTRD